MIFKSLQIKQIWNVLCRHRNFEHFFHNLFAVDEQIELQIFWNIASDMECSQSTFSYEIRKLLTQELEALGLEIKNVKECANKIALNMKCTRKIAYSNFVKDGGQISIISRILFSHVPASFLILSAYLDTNFVNDSVSGQGKVLYYLVKLVLSSKIFNSSIIIHSEVFLLWFFYQNNKFLQAFFYRFDNFFSFLPQVWYFTWIRCQRFRMHWPLASSQKSSRRC